MLLWFQHLLKNGYTILEIKQLQLSDFDLMIRALEIETEEAKKEDEEVETTLDKAFPFLFG